MTEDYTEAKLGYLIRMDTHASLPRPQSHIISRLFFSFFTVSKCLFLRCVQAYSRMSSSCLPHCCTYKEGLLTLELGSHYFVFQDPKGTHSAYIGSAFSVYGTVSVQTALTFPPHGTPFSISELPHHSLTITYLQYFRLQGHCLLIGCHFLLLLECSLLFLSHCLLMNVFCILLRK